MNGSIASPGTVVHPDATLRGTGTVLGQVTNYGYVSPGNSPGTLTVGGNYTQLATGTLQIAVAGALPEQFSVLAVGGHASLAGAVQVVKYGAATLKSGDTLKILTAVGGVNGIFSTAINPFASGSMLRMTVPLRGQRRAAHVHAEFLCAVRSRRGPHAQPDRRCTYDRPDRVRSKGRTSAGLSQC